MMEDHLVPKLAQLLDAVEIQSTGPDSLLLITRDGTRASLRLTLTPSKSTTLSCSHSARRNSFNRLHRGSKRASQRRNQVATPAPECRPEPVESVVHVAQEVCTPPVVAEPVKESGAAAKRTRSVRRRPSQSKSLAKKGFSMSMAIPPSKVATLASKFNSLISTSSTAPPSADKKRSTATRHTPDVGDKKSSVRSLPSRLIETIPEASYSNEPCEAEAEVEEPKTQPEEIPERPSTADPTVGRSTTADQRPNPSAGVYGTVKSIVKQAIRKFERLDSSATATSGASSNESSPSVARSWHSVSVLNQSEATHASMARTMSLVAELPARKEPSLPDGIAPNSSFLWRDKQSIQNLIYEATLFNERQDKTSTGTESYYEIGSSRYEKFEIIAKQVGLEGRAEFRPCGRREQVVRHCQKVPKCQRTSNGIFRT